MFLFNNFQFEECFIFTSDFSSSFFITRSGWARWPRVKVRLERVRLIALDDTCDTCRLWPVFTSKIVLEMKGKKKWEAMIEIRLWLCSTFFFYLNRLTSSFPLIHLSYSANPDKNLSTTVQEVTLSVLQHRFG